jgi:glutathione synthase/RimK-type ligase-like ATP-grasp enzyme
VSERFPAHPEDIAWNLARGGRLINVVYDNWDPAICRGAIEATKRLGLDWAAIDIALDDNDNVVVFEANTAPGLRNPYTIKQIAKTFSWIGRHSTEYIERHLTAWTNNLLHPALRSRLH